MLVKNQKNFLLHFDPVFSNGVKDATLRQFFLINLVYVTPFFEGYLGLISCIIVLKD